MKYFPIFSPFYKTSIQTELKLTFAVVCVQTRDDERNNYFPKKNFSNPLKIHYNVTIWDNGCYFPSLDSFHPSYNTYSRLDCYIIVCVQKLIRTQNYCYFFLQRIDTKQPQLIPESSSLQIRQLPPKIMISFNDWKTQFRFVTHLFFLFDSFGYLINAVWISRDVCEPWMFVSFPPLFLIWTCMLQPYWKWYCLFPFFFEWLWNCECRSNTAYHFSISSRWLLGNIFRPTFILISPNLISQ